MNTLDRFDQKMAEMSEPARPSLTVEGESHVKLKRNLDMALDLHRQAMAFELIDIPAQDKRLAVESAHVTVKAALTTDRTALKARQEDNWEKLFIRVLFHRKALGMMIRPKDVEKLKNATRAELEAALTPRQVAEYDQMTWDAEG